MPIDFNLVREQEKSLRKRDKPVRTMITVRLSRELHNALVRKGTNHFYSPE